MSHTPVSMFIRDEADCVLCGQNTKAEEGVFIIETKCSPWGMSWCWGNSSALSMYHNSAKADGNSPTDAVNT